MKLLKWGGAALGGALLLALLVAMVVSAFTTRTIELTATCAEAPCPHTSVRVAVPKAYDAAGVRADGCGVRLRLRLAAAPASAPRGEVSRLADGRTLTRSARTVTLAIPGDDGASLLTGTPKSSCAQGRRLGADDLVRAFSDARAEGGSRSGNGLLPSVPKP